MTLSRRTLHYCAIAFALLWAAESARAHDGYMNWKNKQGFGCCNNTDCRPIPESDERTVNGELQVFVRGVGIAAGQSAWCPVLAKHYLSSGNAPDWSSSHACVSGHYGAQTPCGQFICYQPRPGF